MEKKIYITPQVEEMTMEPLGCIMKTSYGAETGGGSAPAPRRRGDIIE